jgi:hypothetical protein
MDSKLVFEELATYIVSTLLKIDAKMRPQKSSGSLLARHKLSLELFATITIPIYEYSTTILEMAETQERTRLPVIVDKPTPYTFDLGYLLANDPNPLELKSENIEDDLSATARDGAQALINQLLGTCPITSAPSGVLLTLPAPSTHLPREKVRFFNVPVPHNV